MGLTVAAGDLFASFITGEAVGSVGQQGPLYAFGRGTGGVSGVLFLRNGDTGAGATPRGEDTYTKAADAQNALATTAAQPT